MREIKFRTWNKNTSLIEKMNYQPFTDSYYSTDEGTLLNDFFTDSNFIFMQYTGLKDKNGQEIYEGDIVKIPNEKPFKDFICEVQFNDGCFDLVNKEKDFRDYLKCWTCNYAIEVIGNICENPELLD